MTDDERQEWVDRYAAAWASRQPRAMADLWHVDGRLRHPLIDREIDGSLVPVNNDRTKAAVPDLEWRLQSWAGRGEAVFLEFEWTGTVNGVRVSFGGVDRMRVVDGLIVEEVVHVDTYPLRRALDDRLPDTTVFSADELRARAEPFDGRPESGARMGEEELKRWIDGYVASWASRERGVKAALWHADGVLHHPLIDGPIDGATLPTFDDEGKALVPDVAWDLRGWARRGDVLFLEFQWTGTINGVRVELDGVDRMILRGDGIAEEVVYADTYPVRRALDPQLPDASIVRAADLEAVRAGAGMA